MVARLAPLLPTDVLRSNGQQLADVVLYGTYVTACVYYLRLDAQVRSLHLVDGGAVGLAVLPQGLFGIERLMPQAVGHGEYLQLAVEHLQQVVLLGHGGYQIGTHGLLLHLSLQHHGLGSTLLVGDGTKDVDVHRQLQRQVVGLVHSTAVEAGQRALGGEDE